MAVSGDILEAYVAPRRVMARKLSTGQREDRALATLMGACVLIFVAQWPDLSRQAHLDPSIPLDARVGGALLAWVMIAPLGLYVVAALLHLVTRVFRGYGTWYSSRLALFWSLLALSPLILLRGLVVGFIGPSAALQVMSFLVVMGFLWLWGNAMIVAERGGE